MNPFIVVAGLQHGPLGKNVVIMGPNKGVAPGDPNEPFTNPLPAPIFGVVEDLCDGCEERRAASPDDYELCERCRPHLSHGVILAYVATHLKKPPTP